jgi:hypothetical protein
LVLVFTSVVMTQKPEWMLGKEESLIKTASAASLSTGKTNAELMVTRRRGRWQSLASIDSNPSAASLGKLAVDEAAAHPGGLQHLDDYYVPITPGNKKTINAAGNSEVDKKIPVRAIESAVYPLIGGFSEMPESGQSATEAFGEHLRANGLSDKGIAAASGGHGPNESPFSRGVREVVGIDQGFKTSPLDPGADTRWAMYVAVFLVLIGLVVLLAYYLLPQGALHRSFWDDWTVEHGSQTYYPDVAPPPKPDRQPPAMPPGFSAGSATQQARRQEATAGGRFEMTAAAAGRAGGVDTILA